MDKFSAQVQKILLSTDILLNGSRPWDIKVSDDRFYRRVLSGGSLGLGESYMDGWWSAAKLDQFFYKLLGSDVEKKIKPTLNLVLLALLARFGNPQKLGQAAANASHHYDIGNNLYQAMLDKRLMYSCGYWREANNLDQAQEAKLDLICRKIGLRTDQRILDIGCGWGGFAKFAAERYGAQVTAITVSKNQASLAKEVCQGLPIEIRLQDYRQLSERFDHIVSIGMFEHVGYKNYRRYMEVVSRCLKDGGLFLLHTIGNNRSVRSTDPWLAKYIFPNSMLPSAAQITKAIEGLFVMEDWHNFGPDYDKTLMAWFENFNAHWSALKGKYDERFYRMWKYYLLACAGLFRARKAQLWQIVLSKSGVPGGYTPVR